MVDVKICGLSTPETMETALEADADFVGLVFYPRSPRNVSLEQAARLAEQARGRANIVVLTVDADDRLIDDIARNVKPDWYQLQGSETPERVSAIRALAKKPVIKAIKIGASEDVNAAQKFNGFADMLLFEAKAPPNALPGGNGIVFDWRLLGKDKTAKRFMLSGGLNHGNVAEAIAVTRAPIVDVSSGVESAPGKKDVNLIRKFIEAAKASG
jgi:phosphoribosylanthranilate isomerase